MEQQRKVRNRPSACLLAVAAMLAGCAAGGPGVRPPETPEELDAQHRLAPKAFSAAQIVQHNIARVSDRRLPAAQRVASLTVLVGVDGDNPANYPVLAGLLERPDESPAVRQAVLYVLARKDYAGIGAHVGPVLVETFNEDVAGELRAWLARHPSPEATAPLARAWADADPNDLASRQRYVTAIEAATGQPWAQGLLEALDSPDFKARGSAWELLLHHANRAELIDYVRAAQPRTPAMAALQYFAGRLGYLPADRNELLRATVLYGTMRLRLDGAAGTAQAWSAQNGYCFALQDVHLLGWVAGCTGGAAPAVPPRQQVAARLPARLADRQVDLADRLGRLSMADLVRLSLLLEWLQAGKTANHLATLAGVPDPQRIGGLIVCGQEGPEAIFYPSTSPKAFVPNDEMVQASRDCLAWVVLEPRPDQARTDLGPAVGDPQARLRDCPALIIIRQGNELLASYWTTAGREYVEVARIPLSRPQQVQSH